MNGQVARMSSLGKDWSDSRMAPKPRGAVGATAWRQGSGFEVVCRLDTPATVFQADAGVRAISECALAMLEGDCRGKPVVFCSDSQAALGAWMDT